MARTPKGVRQVNENLLQEGRAIIVTEENFDNLDWNNIPDGSLHVDKETGAISYKKEGQTTWLPAGIKDEATLVISRDSQFTDEFFKIITTDNGDGTFTYENERGERRTKPIIKDKGYVFELDKGTYLNGRNHLEVTIDGVLLRTVSNKGIEELSEVRFILCDTLEVGQEVSVRYIQWVRIGNPWPRIFLNQNVDPGTGEVIKPETAQEGDFWLRSNASLEETDSLGEEWDNYDKISWDKIDSPTTLKDYGIKDNVSYEGHRHSIYDVDGFPEHLPADGGDASTLRGLTYLYDDDKGLQENQKVIVVLESDSRLINEAYIPTIDANKLYGKIDQERLPRIKTSLLDGTINLNNLDVLPLSKIDKITSDHLAEVIKLDKIPNIPVSKIEGKFGAKNLNNIDPSLLTSIPVKNFDTVPLPENYIPKIPVSRISNIYIQANQPSTTTEGSIWFCTNETTGAHIEVYSGGKWIKFGAVWK